jgi:hypothetical protein
MTFEELTKAINEMPPEDKTLYEMDQMCKMYGWTLELWGKEMTKRASDEFELTMSQRKK